MSGNHHHSNGSGDGHPQTEAISPILPRGTLDTWVTMAAPSSTSSTGGNNAASASASQLATADSFVPADIFVSAAGEDHRPARFFLFPVFFSCLLRFRGCKCRGRRFFYTFATMFLLSAGNLGLSVPPGACVCILCGHFVPQNQLEKHQCNGAGAAGSLLGGGCVAGGGNGGGSGGRSANPRSTSPLVAMNHGILAPSLTSQPAPQSPSGSSAAEGPPISFHGRDVSSHLLQSVGKFFSPDDR